MDNTTVVRLKVAGRVRGLMDSAGTTRNELAKQIGMPSTTLYRCLHGTRDFSVSEIVAVAQALGAEVGDILPAETRATA